MVVAEHLFELGFQVLFKFFQTAPAFERDLGFESGIGPYPRFVFG